MSSRDKHSPATSLASLEYLQNQRRGSITDPSLHAAQKGYPTRLPREQQSSSSSTSSAYPDSRLQGDLPDPRPSSPYVFGNATAHSNEQGSQLRKLLHTPPDHRPTSSSMSHDSPDHSRMHAGLGMSKEPNSMNIDNERQAFMPRRTIRDPPSFDFSMRRHSIAVGQAPITLPNLSSTLGTKRKMSGDRSIFPPVGEDIDPQLVGPGVPSGMDIDADAPAPKRRGSTIDMQRIAQLSLNDRRNSVDSRGWVNDRRESAPSLFQNVPGFNSINSGLNPSSEAHNGRGGPPGLSNFSWPPNSSEPSNPSGLSNDSSRQFDPMHQMNLVPPMNYPPDRRMSVPDALTHPASSSRSLRPLSRPPSRQNTDPHSGPSSGQDEPSSASSPNHVSKASKDSGITPYSRSPELRVSHKLAERKRRREMKDLFDELRDQLPADRGMKASKWEILSKAIDFVAQLKRSHEEMAQELDILRQQVHGRRPEGLPVYPSAGGGGGPAGGAPPPPQSAYGGSSMIQPYPTTLVQPLQQPSANQNSSQQPGSHLGNDSRPSNSSQSLFSNSTSQNTNGHRIDGSS